MGISSKAEKAKQDAQRDIDREMKDIPDAGSLANEVASGFNLRDVEYEKSDEAGTHKTTFDPVENDKSLLSLNIESITFKSGAILDAVIVKYSDGPVVQHGGMGGCENKISLLGDSIKRVTGVCNVDFCSRMLISNICIETEKGKKYGPFGMQTRGKAFELYRPGCKINALFGSVDDRYISSLGAYFVEK